MFGEKSLHSLMKLAEELQSKPINSETGELLKLLSRPHVKSLLSVHDTVAQKSYDPELPPLPDDIDDDEDSVKIIRLVKNKEPLVIQIQVFETNQVTIAFSCISSCHNPELIYSQSLFTCIDAQYCSLPFGLGATIKRDENTGAVVVARIMRGGAADRSGLIHVGDELREVNGIPVEDKKPEEIIHILAQSQGAITFKIIPGINENTSSKEPKALTNPKPTGLRRSFRLSRKDRKTNKSMYECQKSEQYDMADVPTYEEVTPYRRQSSDKYRLVVLVGPVGVGLNELKRKLLVSDPQHYSVTVPRALLGMQDASYSLENAGSHPGYAIADRDRGFPGGGAQLAERRLGREGLGRQGNPQFTVRQGPLWLIGRLRVCSGAIQICVVLRHCRSDGFAVDPQCEKRRLGRDTFRRTCVSAAVSLSRQGVAAVNRDLIITQLAILNWGEK
ncbi:UNVERIFIED_CONTAM: hypothetical protein FKN15_024323 [Acipenser sinensis]